MSRPMSPPNKSKMKLYSHPTGVWSKWMSHLWAENEPPPATARVPLGRTDHARVRAMAASSGFTDTDPLSAVWGHGWNL